MFIYQICKLKTFLKIQMDRFFYELEIFIVFPERKIIYDMLIHSFFLVWERIVQQRKTNECSILFCGKIESRLCDIS